jgi:2-haloacid dehalogenase
MADLTMCRQARAATLADVSCPPANGRFLVPERPIIVFDVNETLLDLETIRPVFDRIFNDPAAMRLWFAGLITYSEALTLAGVYVPFTDIGGAVLRMLAATRGITIREISGRQLERAGVIDVFERRFSVDETVRRHKPTPEAYHSVAAALTADPGGICLIASHVWDTIGAGAVGWQAALILREGNVPFDVAPQPDYIGKDLDAIADQLIERYGPNVGAFGG